MAISERKRRGAWYTPLHLIAEIVEAVFDAAFVEAHGARPVRVLDPACGDGRFLHAAAERVDALGGRVELHGYDIDADAITAARHDVPAGHFVCADALGADGPREVFDVVIGNPPFLSQLATATTRGAASRHGGGPYADAAVEFLALGAEVVRDDGGRLAFVLPQSIVSARDATPVRERIDRQATMSWSSWTGGRDFDAQVVTCALAFEFGRPSSRTPGVWTHVITERTGVPPVAAAMSAGALTLADRAWLNANFRDEYYGMIPAVGDHDVGPPLVTSGLIDPGKLLWGRRSVRFAKRRFTAPRVDLDRLDASMQRWAQRRLVPKVLVANQTRVLEAVCDPTGELLPGVPVIGIYPHGPDPQRVRAAWEIAAVLTSASASAWAWHQRGGTGLSATTIRVGPVMLGELPLPRGELSSAVAALERGDVVECGTAVDEAYGIDRDVRDELMAWWRPALERLAARSG